MQKISLLLLLSLLGPLPPSAVSRAAEPLVFVSAFASGENGGIHCFSFNDKTGQLAPLQRTEHVPNPFFLALSPDGRFLYSTYSERFGGKEAESVAAYSLDGRTGRLTFLNRASSKGRATCYVTTDATGKTVLTANYSSGSVASLSVGPGGELSEPVSFFEHPPEKETEKPVKSPKAHSIITSPDNRFVFAADLGLDKIFIYQLDAATATLTPNAAQPFVLMAPGTEPRHLTFHPNGRRLYAINEAKSSVTFFEYQAQTGVLSERQTISTLPEGFTGKSACADLKITPDGTFLFGSNRGHDSIAVYRIGEDGSLALLSIEPSLGKGPQNLLITPDGGWLLCANMKGNNVSVFKIEAANGSLKPAGEPISMPSPSCLRLLP
jgi:6-phosphogluconolactonase